MNDEIRHICMAEDDPDDFNFFSEILGEINKKVKLTWFQTCEHLIQFLKAGTDLPCLIVLDMNMPRMSGQNCLITIKKVLNLHHIPVIIFSTAGHQSIINLAYEAGASRYILKPCSLDEFRNTVRDILATPLPGR